MKTAEELEREINERAQKIMNSVGSASYEDFKKAQLGQNRKHEEETLEIFREENKELSQQKEEVVSSESTRTVPIKQDTNTPNGKVIRFAGYGGFWVRLAASILERIILVFISAISVGVLFLSIGNGVEDLEPNFENISFFIIPILLVLSFYAYNIYLYFKDGQSIGYKMLGLKVIDKNTGRKPSTGKLLGRFGIKALLTWIPYINLIGYIVIAFMIGLSDKKEGPHDRLSGTLVVSEKESKTWIIVIIIAGIFGVIAIVGISAGVLFVAINPAEQTKKAQDSMVRTSLSMIRTQGTMYFVQDNTYENFCNTITEPEFICNDSETEFVVFAPMGDKTYCVDANGFDGEIDEIDMDKTSCK